MVFFCECKSDVGNPPPLVYWTKDGKNIGDFGYGMKSLTTNDITKGVPAMYSCNVKSHNLTDQKHITLGKSLSFYFTNKIFKAISFYVKNIILFHLLTFYRKFTSKYFLHHCQIWFLHISLLHIKTDFFLRNAPK